MKKVNIRVGLKCTTDHFQKNHIANGSIVIKVEGRTFFIDSPGYTNYRFSFHPYENNTEWLKFVEPKKIILIKAK